jgi:transposase, IS5 family
MTATSRWQRNSAGAIRATWPGVEHVFAGQKLRMGLFIRTIGMVRARIKIAMANLAYNFRRLIWLEGRTAPA